MNRTRVQDVQVGESTSRVFSTSGPSTAGPAPTFILLHGIGMSHRYLTRLHAALSAVGDTHSIDLPGFGANPRPSGPLSVESFATIAGRVLDHLGIASAIVIGHSMGTQFAIELARQRPALVSHVVLMGPVVDSRRRTVWQQALALARDSLREPPSVNFTVFTDYWRCGPRWYLTELTAMMDYPTEDRIQDVGAPVLVVRGADDPIAGPEWCRMLAVKAGRGTFVEIPGARHVVQQSAPGRVASVILAFVNGSTVSPEGGRRVSTVARRAWWWALDYAFAAKWQARSMVDWTDPRKFQTGTKRPVVIIPGVYESWQFLRPLIDDLHEAQHPVHVVTLLQHNRLPVVRAAHQVAGYLARHDLEDVVIVAHSKGGLIGKFLMVELDSAARIAGMVAIASPFSGSRYARFMLLPTLRTFSPSNATTVRLAKEFDVNARITSVFASFDPHIPEGSVLPGGRNIRIPGGGHFRVIAHPQAREAVRVAVGEA